MIVKNDDFTITIYDNRLDGSNFRYSATVLQRGTKEAKAIKVLADRVAALESENAALLARAENAEAMVEQLIEAGEFLAESYEEQWNEDDEHPTAWRWNNLVSEWDCRNDKPKEAK